MVSFVDFRLAGVLSLTTFLPSPVFSFKGSLRCNLRCKLIMVFVGCAYMKILSVKQQSDRHLLPGEYITRHMLCIMQS